MADKKMKITYPKLLVGASSIGLIASFWQAAERVTMLKNPGGELSCNINPVVDCGSVLGDNLAAVFGPPNAFIGMVVFTMLLAFGLQRLTGGSWSSFVQKLVVVLSKVMFLFSAWFFWVSLYSLGTVCIFCMFIWAVSVPIGIYGVKDYLESQKKLKGLYSKINNFLQKHHFTVLVTIYSVMIILYFLRFQDYYFA